jgi:hypothetical protein
MKQVFVEGFLNHPVCTDKFVYAFLHRTFIAQMDSGSSSLNEFAPISDRSHHELFFASLNNNDITLKHENTAQRCELVGLKLGLCFGKLQAIKKHYRGWCFRKLGGIFGEQRNISY